MSGMARRNQAAGPVKFTYDDLVAWPADGLRHELIDGEHHVSAASNTRHQLLSARLVQAFMNWLDLHPFGQAFAAPYDLVLSRHDVVEPDLVYLSNERASTQLNRQHAAGADLVIEILSPGTRQRDESLKRALYERCGVLEYWCVDPDADVILVQAREGQRLGAPVEFASSLGDVLTTPLLPAFVLNLTPLFRR
jgi:Uma2 family endonuclease